MDKLAWLPSFEVGVDRIDNEHKHLFELARRIPHELEAGAGASVTRFIAAVERHFEQEEHILENSGFPGLEEHKRYHRSLLRKARQLQRLCEVERHRGKIDRCYIEVVGFLLDDVVRGDMNFKSHLQFHAS